MVEAARRWFIKKKNDDIFFFSSANEAPLLNNQKNECGAVFTLSNGNGDDEIKVMIYFCVNSTYTSLI